LNEHSLPSWTTSQHIVRQTTSWLRCFGGGRAEEGTRRTLGTTFKTEGERSPARSWMALEISVASKNCPFSAAFFRLRGFSSSALCFRLLPMTTPSISRSLLPRNSMLGRPRCLEIDLRWLFGEYPMFFAFIFIYFYKIIINISDQRHDCHQSRIFITLFLCKFVGER